MVAIEASESRGVRSHWTEVGEFVLVAGTEKCVVPVASAPGPRFYRVRLKTEFRPWSSA